VSHLFLGAWEGTGNEVWKLLPGLEQRKTPLSDHLHELFESWTADYVFTKGEYTALFEQFELLASLAFITLSNDTAALRAAIQDPNRGFAWCPMGRAAWHGSVSRQILDSWKGELEAPLLEAGFARGSHDFLLLAIQSIGVLSSRLGWY